jgi:hypothetical protein
MIRLGRVLTVLGVLWFVVGLSLTNVALRGLVNGSPILLRLIFALGAVGTISVVAAWGLALYHWRRQFEGTATAKRRWGVALVLGMFVAAWVYWITRPGEIALGTSSGLATGKTR